MNSTPTIILQTSKLLRQIISLHVWLGGRVLGVAAPRTVSFGFVVHAGVLRPVPTCTSVGRAYSTALCASLFATNVLCFGFDVGSGMLAAGGLCIGPVNLTLRSLRVVFIELFFCQFSQQRQQKARKLFQLAQLHRLPCTRNSQHQINTPPMHWHKHTM